MRGASPWQRGRARARGPALSPGAHPVGLCPLPAAGGAGSPAGPPQSRASAPLPAGARGWRGRRDRPGAGRAARARSSRALPARRAGQPQPSLVLPCVPASERVPAPRPAACASAVSSEPRRDFARLLVSDAWGLGDQSPALRAAGGDGASWLSLAPQSSEKHLENEGLLLFLFFHYWPLSCSSLGTHTQHCIAHSSPKCLSLALLGCPWQPTGPPGQAPAGSLLDKGCLV